MNLFIGIKRHSTIEPEPPLFAFSGGIAMLVSLIAVVVVEKLESHAAHCDFDRRALISVSRRRLNSDV